VLDTIDLAPGIVANVLSEQAGALKNPPTHWGLAWNALLLKPSDLHIAH